MAALLDFQYQARDRAGKAVQGVLSAETLSEATRQLRDKALFPLKVEQKASLKNMAAKRKVGGRVPARQLAKFYSQMSDLMRSGVPLLRSLDLLAKQSSNERLREVVVDIKAKVADGVSMADAMKLHEKVFGDLACSMVKAGQEGGFLEDVFKRVSVFTEKQEDLKGKVIGAVAYPIVLLGIGTMVVSVLLVYFVPQFATIFDRMRDRDGLPWATEALLTFSAALQSYGLFILAGVVFAFFVVRRRLDTPAGRRLIDAVKLKIPIGGVVFRDLGITRFNRVLGTLRRNGVPILAALKIAKDSTGNLLMREAIEKAADNVQQGDKLSAPLRASGVFPPEIVEMIDVAEESNNLENVLIESADSLEAATTQQLEMAVRFLEPMLLLVMAALTMAVVIALLLPIFKMSSNV